MDSYFLIFSDGTLDAQVLPNTAPTFHGLTFTGRGQTDYGAQRNESILHLAENFAQPDLGGLTPGTISDPAIGQVWFDTTTELPYVYDGLSWVPLGLNDFVVSASGPTVGGLLTFTRNLGTDIVVSNVAAASEMTDHFSNDNPAHPASDITFTGGLGLNVQTAIETVVNNITAHINDGVGVHAASAISFVNPGAPFDGPTNDVQEAIDDIEDQLDTVVTSTTSSSNNLTNHINDAIDAHDASAISFDNTGTGLSATNVQDAIDEILSGAGTPGALETTRAVPTGTQAILGTLTRIQFQTVEFGNDTSQWNVGTSVYTAGFDQEVNVTFGLGFFMRNDGTGSMVIQQNGTTQRVHEMSNNDNNSDGSALNASFADEINVKLLLNAGDTVECRALLLPALGIHQTEGPGTKTFVEFEVVRAL